MKLSPTVLEAKRYGVFSCAPQTPLPEAARRMVDEDISALVVIDGGGALAGVLSRTDVLRAYLAGTWERARVEEHMSRDVITVRAEDELGEVARLLVERHIHRVVVVRPDGEWLRPLAVVSDADLLYHLVQST